MVVKIGTVCSPPKPITGGAVQGSVLGVLDHNAVLENLDDDILDVYVAKYIHDITIVEQLPKDIPYIEQTDHQLVHPPRTQSAFNTTLARAESKSMKINANKTQILSISSAATPIRSFLTSDSGTIPPNQSLKMLGFVFDERPAVHKQIESLITKANKRCLLYTSPSPRD